LGEIALCILFFIHPVAKILGDLLEWLMRMMNSFIESIDSVAFTVWDGISISIAQTILLTAMIAGISFWLLEKRRPGFWLFSVCLAAFLVLHSFSFFTTTEQKKLIVYNVPKYQAVDLIDGQEYMFVGDPALKEANFLRNFHIKPTRILYRAQEEKEERVSKFFTFYNKKIILIDTTVHLKPSTAKEVIDVLILSHNPKIYIPELEQTFTTKQIVIDGSVPAWKAKLWKKDCDSLHIPCYDVSENGAFVMNLQ
jgi:competence protein ComEC